MSRIARSVVASLFAALSLFLFAATTAFAQPDEEPTTTATATAAAESTATATATAPPAATEEPDEGEPAAAERGEGEHEGGEHAEHGGHHGPAPMNWTDVWDHKRPAFVAILINFGLLAFGYYLLGRKPISEGLKRRRETIGKAIEDAQAMLKEAKDRAKKYQADLKNADTDAASAREALVAAGRGEVDRQLAEANEKAERMKRDAERLIEQERKQVEHDLLVETIELALAEATTSLGKTVTPEDHARLAEDLLVELSKKPTAPRVGGAA